MAIMRLTLEEMLLAVLQKLPEEANQRKAAPVEPRKGKLNCFAQ